MTAKAIPEGYHTLTPYMTVRDAARAVEFYKQAFGAVEKGVMKGPDGKILHAELRIGDSLFMLADEFPQFGSLSPQSIGGSGMGLHIYVEDVDSAFDRAVKAGANVEMPVADTLLHKYYSDSGALVRLDMYGIELSSQRTGMLLGHATGKPGKTTSRKNEINWVTATFMMLFHVGAVAALFFFTWKAFFVALFLGGSRAAWASA
jgi:PhnB protein